MPLSGKQWAVGEALKAEHRQDHNALPLVLAGSGISVTAYGAGTAESGATNTAAIQSALAAEPIVVVPAGTFNLDAAGVNPYNVAHKYCLDLPSDTTLILAPGAVLRLADGQQTDAGGAVDIIVASAVSNVTVTGKGSILGNTAGQTGWSGGYGQVGKGNIIRFYGGSSDIVVEGVTLGDHFSNPVIVGDDITRSERVRLSGLYCYDVGEGLLMWSVDESWIDDCTVEEITDVMVGDGIEWSLCVNFTSKGCKLISAFGAAGTAFDIFGSSKGVVSDFVIDGWGSGIDLNSHGDGTDSTSVTISDGRIVLPANGFVGVWLKSDDMSDVSVSNVGVTGGTFGFRVGHDNFKITTGGVLVEGCSALGAVVGLVIYTIPDVTISGGRYCNNSQQGIRWDGQDDADSPADTKNLSIVGVTCTGNGQFGIRLTDSSTTGKEPTGGIVGNVLTGNTSGGYSADGGVDISLTVDANAT